MFYAIIKVELKKLYIIFNSYVILFNLKYAKNNYELSQFNY